MPYGKNGLDALHPELLRKIPGLELTVLDSQCCVLPELTDSKKRTTPLPKPSATTVPPDRRERRRSGGHRLRNCKWQIEMSTSLRCEHPITLRHRRWLKLLSDAR